MDVGKQVIASSDLISHGESRFFIDAAFKSFPARLTMRVVLRTSQGVLELKSRRTSATA